MRSLWLTLFLLVVVVSPFFILTGCGPSAAERKEAQQQEIEDEDQYTDTEEEELEEE